MDVAGLLSETSKLPLPEAAARYAAGGIPVFPCVPGEKSPLTEHGFHDATTRLSRVRSWWAWMPLANVGIPTGAASGIDVVDIDWYPTASGFALYNRARHAHLTVGWSALVRTPSGGIHAYYPADPDHGQQSWSAPRVHVDFRGDGGYIVAPPSLIGTTQPQTGYALIAAAKRAASPVDAETLHSFLDPLPAPTVPPRQQHALDVDGLARWVAARGEGERNRALFWAACRAAETGLSAEELHAVLGPAAQQAGLAAREVAATLRSAVRTTVGREGRTRTAHARHPPPPKLTDSGRSPL
jgi:hypothetical protein